MGFHQNFSDTERRKSLVVKYNISDTIVSQLRQVRDSLMKDNRSDVLNKNL
jgi:hypothetical protein